MRRLLVIGALVAVLAAAGTAAAGRIPKFPALAGAWSHAEINVKIGRKPHTLILDRGRITKLSPSELRLAERDGSTASIPVSPATKVAVGHKHATLASLHRGMNVETMRIDGGTAVRVRVGR